MDAVKYFKEKARMTKNCNVEFCHNCPLSVNYNLMGERCNHFEQLKPDEAIKIVEKWAKAHPQKTRKQDFFEKHQNVLKDSLGYPEACCEKLGYCEECTSETCYDCWEEPVED